MRTLYFMLRTEMIIIVVIFFIFSSCKRYLDVGNPADKIVAEYVYNSDRSAAAVLSGIYSNLGFVQGKSSISVGTGLFADELISFPTNYELSNYYLNQPTGEQYWGAMYGIIYRINAAIVGLSKSNGLTSRVREQLLGEAKFLRGFFYYYLVEIYGDLPLLLTTDIKVNASAKRESKERILEQIVIDLVEAKKLLNEDYLAANVDNQTIDRVRPNKFSAAAMLARVYLVMEKWENALIEADYVINNHALYDTVPLNEVFRKNSKEAIWQLQPPTTDVKNTIDAQLFVLENGPDESVHPVWLSSLLISAFEPEDQRLNKWIGIDSTQSQLYYYAFKYKAYKPEDPQTEYFTVLRLAEQYLVKSEALIQLDRLEEGIEALNVVRLRAGLKDIGLLSKEKLLSALLRERRVEFFTEWGHRWFDLKRSNKIDEVMEVVAPQKGGVWKSYKKLLPIPYEDLRLNPNLTQNPGYPN